MHGFLDIQWSPWKRTLLTRVIALGPSLLFAIAFTNKMDTFSQVLNVQQSVQIPFVIIPLLSFNCNQRIMGSFALKGWKELFMWCLSMGIVLMNIYIIQSTVSTFFHNGTWQYVGTWTFMAVYLSVIAWIIYDGRIRLCWEKVSSKFPPRAYKESISYPNAWSGEINPCSLSPETVPSAPNTAEKTAIECNERTPLLKKSTCYE